MLKRSGNYDAQEVGQLRFLRIRGKWGPGKMDSGEMGIRNFGENIVGEMGQHRSSRSVNFCNIFSSYRISSRARTTPTQDLILSYSWFVDEWIHRGQPRYLHS